MFNWSGLVHFHLEQSDAYKQEVLPNSVRISIVVAAAESLGWHHLNELDGDRITMNRFGASALAVLA